MSTRTGEREGGERETWEIQTERVRQGLKERVLGNMEEKKWGGGGGGGNHFNTYSSCTPWGICQLHDFSSPCRYKLFKK